MDINFFYGSWNHKLAQDLNIGRDLDLWSKGIVTYPEPSSADFQYSDHLPAAHSVLIVGYDDSVMVKYSKKMLDGSIRNFQRKGVYYFKNSWGTDSFGIRFQWNENFFPGYGMIVQDYANEYGQFTRLVARQIGGI